MEPGADLVDRISALPDSVLCLILSDLPTKNVVATSILSKRWEFVWMKVSNLDFCQKYWKDEDNEMKFIRFVNRVLLLHDGGSLNQFRLAWTTRSIPSHVSSWITTAITRNVHNLFLDVGVSSDPLELPINLFSCNSLQCLELNGRSYVSSATIVFSLPKLESLKLVSVSFQSDETFQKLISGCPMLNYLYVRLEIEHFTSQDYVFTYRISSPSLRYLYLFGHLWDLTCSLELEASSLEYLKIDGSISQVFVQGSLSSLVEADFRIILNNDQFSEDIYNSLAKGVGYFDCAKALTLSAHVMLALSNATASLSTTFSRLTKLKAGVICCYFSSLQDFLQSSDSLEVMTIYEQTSDRVGYNHDHSNWTVPVEVPKCLSNSLKEVSFESYTGSDDEREMIGYLLKHGSALEVMQVTFRDYKLKGNKIDLVEEICTFPRKSPACNVKFIE